MESRFLSEQKNIDYIVNLLDAHRCVTEVVDKDSNNKSKKPLEISYMEVSEFAAKNSITPIQDESSIGYYIKINGLVYYLVKDNILGYLFGKVKKDVEIHNFIDIDDIRNNNDVNKESTAKYLTNLKQALQDAYDNCPEQFVESEIEEFKLQKRMNQGKNKF